MNSKNIPALTAELVAQCIDCLKKFEDLLKEVLETLTPEERIRLRKMSDGDIEMVNKCLRNAEMFKEHYPANYDLPGFQKLVALFSAFQPILARFQVTAEKMDDTRILIRNIMITRAEDSYSMLKHAGKNDAAVKAALDDIAQHYKGRGGKKKTPEQK